jgi:cytochrome c-type biogenesis protein
MTGIIQIPLLDYDLRPHLKSNAAPNFLSSFLLGIFFSAGWSPCVGPILGSILTLAANGQLSLQYGVVLLSAYSLGLALPFMAAALGIGWVVNISRKYKKQLHAVEIVMGIILIIIGVMLFLGVFQQLKSFGSLFQLGL